MRIVFIVGISILIIVALLWTRPDSYAELRPLPATTVTVDFVRQTDIQPVTQITG